MSVFTKESVSDLLFSKIDAIVIVDAEKDSYNTVKKWAAATGHFRFYHRNGARTGYACEFVEI